MNSSSRRKPSLGAQFPRNTLEPFGGHPHLSTLSRSRRSLPPHPYQSVSNNPIKDWTLDVSGLRKMRHLRLKGVGLDQCPEGIGRLNKLETLDLSDNRIAAFEQSTASLFKLTLLDLSGNNIPVRACASNSVDGFFTADASKHAGRVHTLEFFVFIYIFIFIRN